MRYYAVLEEEENPSKWMMVKQHNVKTIEISEGSLYCFMNRETTTRA
jgi:hypothetical protein